MTRTMHDECMTGAFLSNGKDTPSRSAMCVFGLSTISAIATTVPL